jgi:hypothetical protein
MDVLGLLRAQLEHSHGVLEETVADLTPGQVRWSPPGHAQAAGPNYAHVVLTEDVIVASLLQLRPPLAATTYSGKTGISEPPPVVGPWDRWAEDVEIDLAALRAYAAAVYAQTDTYLASLEPEDLADEVDLSLLGMGRMELGGFIATYVVSHPAMHAGEISAIKGLQGLQGYPF